MHLETSLSTRNLFGGLLNELGLTGQGAEVGTHRGEFAAVLMEHWRGKLLWCIDPWSVPEGYETQAKMEARRGHIDRERDMKDAKAALRPWMDENRVGFMALTSEQAAPFIARDSLDFVYLDGDHRLIAQDLELWWPKVRSGGVVAGHDLVCPGEEAGGWGSYVFPAVRQFVDEHLKRPILRVIPEENGLPWSFWFTKE